MKYYHLVVTVAQDRNDTIFTERTKPPELAYWSYPLALSEGDNLINTLNQIGGLQAAYFQPSKAAATAKADALNHLYKQRGVFLGSAYAG